RALARHAHHHVCVVGTALKIGAQTERPSGAFAHPTETESMKLPYPGAIDCDLHPAMPGVGALLPYLDEYCRDQLTNRHIDRTALHRTSYPPSAPLSAGPGWRQASGAQPLGAPGGDLAMIRAQALDPFGTKLAICNVLHGAVALFNEDMAAALCAAVNDWTT